jgi:hypothetical protein
MVASLKLFQTEMSSPNDEQFLPHKMEVRKDRQHIAQILKTFNYQTSDAWTILTHHFSSGIRHRELRSIAFILSKIFNIPPITRDAHRSYPVLIKWFQENWTAIEPVLPLISLRDEYDQQINSDRENYDRHGR